MKKFAFITGALSASLTSLGILFKVNHFPGGDWLLIIGITVFALLFVPGITKYLYDRSQ